MVSAVVGQEHGVQVVALCQAGGHGQHDAVAEGHYGGAHIIVIIRTFRNLAPGKEKVAPEVLTDEIQRDYQMGDTQLPAVPAGAVDLPGIVLRARAISALCS